MKIHSFARIVAAPFIITAGVVLYFLFFEDKSEWYPYLLPLAIILAAIYAYNPAIDYWWHKKHPPELPARIKKLIYNSSSMYQSLSEEGRRKFLDRVSIFMYHKAFYLMRKEKEALPEDIKALIATCAVTTTMHQDSFFLKKYDYYIAYQHPFPTPNKQYLHSVEIDHNDGAVVVNAEQLFQSMIAKTGVINVGLYAFSEIFLVNNPLSDLAQLDEPDPVNLPMKHLLSYQNIQLQIGYKEIYFKAVLMAIYFDNPGFVSKYYPEFFKVCESSFNNQDKLPS
jgi:hypothetical protein